MTAPSSAKSSESCVSTNNHNYILTVSIAHTKSLYPKLWALLDFLRKFNKSLIMNKFIIYIYTCKIYLYMNLRTIMFINTFINGG